MRLSSIFYLAIAIQALPNVFQRSSFLAPEHSFSFIIDCDGWNQCELAKQKAQEVGEMIGKQLLFKNPVRVCMKLTPSAHGALLPNFTVPPQQGINTNRIA